MSKEIDKFSNFIEDKLNGFEVPYNESHWTEMSQKLDGLKPTPDVSSGLTKKFLWTGAAAIVAVGAWLFLTQNDSMEKDIPANENALAVENPKPKHKTEILQENVSSEQNEEQPDIVSEKTDVSALEKEKEVDHKYDKYSEFTEQSKKESSEDFVNNAVKEQSATFEGEPKINLDLKTDILLKKDAYCVGEEVQFDIDREIDGAKYYWDFGDLDLKSRKSRPTHKFKKPGTYNIILYVAKGEIGDKNDYPAQKTIVIRPTPKVELEEVIKQITLNDPYAEFVATSDCTCDFEWSFNEKKKAKGQNAFFLVEDKGSYPVMLTATNEAGCSNSINDLYHASKGVKIDVETGLTPNGDGNNDLFIPKELTISNVEFTFTISDKSGQIVFQTSDKYDAWNGNINNSGGPLPSDTYLWKLSFTDDRGKVHNQNGRITLLR